MDIIAIDLKSFYASVECVERHCDPLTTNLVVADPSRTEKTICLAVSPSLKSYGIPGRPRLFEVVQKVKSVNAERRRRCHNFTGKSDDGPTLSSDPTIEVDYIIAPPRMRLYEEYSTKIYSIYTKYIAPEDIHVYSIDEVFMDVTHYLKTYKTTPHDLAMKLIREVLATTGITATAGIGTNLYLAKVAMDIVAKHVAADADGVRIAALDERSYREQLWSHTPLTDFWRVGKGYSRKLEKMGLRTMGDIARASLSAAHEEQLYKVFGVNAELLIDHAWGWEPTTIALIKSYKPSTHSISQGQVLQCGYSYEKARVIVREMTELLVLDLVRKHLVTKKLTLTLGYDTESMAGYTGPTMTDFYGRTLPKSAHGTINVDKPTSSTKKLVAAMMELFDRIVNPKLLARRVYVVAADVINADKAEIEADIPLQLDMFTDYEALERQKEAERAADEREHRLQLVTIDIQDRFGKNALLKGTNYVDGATTRERNRQIGGHKA